LSLNLFESLNRIIIWQSYFQVSTSKYNVEPIVLDVTDPSDITVITTDIVTNITLDADELAYSVVNDNNMIYISYMYFNALRVKQYSPTYYTTEIGTYTKTGSYFAHFGSCVSPNGYVDYLLLNNTGASTYQVVHVRFTQNVGFSSNNVIETFGGMYDATDLSIARDSYDNLCAFWTRQNSTGTNVDVYYSMSSDDGTTWTTPAVINKTAGHSFYTDSITGNLSARSTVIGGINGFCLFYTRDNASAVPKS